jgi:cytochrome P450
MSLSEKRIPPGPQEKYRVGDDLLEWMDRQFREFGDTYKGSVYGNSIYATRDVDIANRVLVENWQNYVKGQSIARVALLLGNGLMVSKGEVWKRQRRMIQPAFNQESVATFVKLITSANLGLLKKWQTAANKNESVNVTRDVSSMALEVVLRLIFGEDYERLALHFDFLSSETARNIEFARSFRALGKIILQNVEQRRQNPRRSGGILDMLMSARDPQSGKLMSENLLIDEILTLIVAGHETTASTLNWCWYLISQHPEVEEQLSNELAALPDSVESLEFGDLSKCAYTRQILDETMRLFPAGWNVTRKTLRDDQLGEYFVPAGTEVYVGIYFIHRHPDLWERPDSFEPDRFRPEKSRTRHRLAAMPFSAGPRNCIGALFARAEMQIHLMTIARHLRLRYVPPGPIELDAGVNLRSKHDFIMYPEVKKQVSGPVSRG